MVAATFIIMLMVLVARPNDPQEAIAAPPGPKVEICHTPPGNPSNGYGVAPKSVTVSARAVPKHLAHSDSIGPCPQVNAVVVDSLGA